MRIFARTFIALSLALTLALPAFAADKTKDAGEKERPDYVAIVNGTKLPYQSLEQKLDFVKKRYASQGQQLKEKQLNSIRQDIADRMVEKELLYQKSQELGVEVDMDKVDEQINQFKEKFDDGKKYQQQLSQMGYTEKLLRNEIKQNMAIQKLIEKEIASRVTLDDEELKKYYKGHTKEFKTPAKVKARHILIQTGDEASEADKKEAKQKIEAAQKRLEGGEKFSKVAKEASDCPSSKKGGDLGFFSKGRMVKGFEDAAFALEPGEVSDIVKTRFGYHLIKVEDKKPASQKSFEDVKGSLKKRLKNERVRNELDSYLNNLKKEADIKMNLPDSAKG